MYSPLGCVATAKHLRAAAICARLDAAAAFPRGAATTLSAMLYRFLRGLNEIYGVTVLFCFIGAFFIAFLFTLIYPIVPLLMLISSIFLVVIARGAFMVMRHVECTVARRGIARGACPACDEPLDAVLVGERRVHECPGCRRIFGEDGMPYVPQEVPEDAGKSATFERSMVVG